MAPAKTVPNGAVGACGTVVIGPPGVTAAPIYDVAGHLSGARQRLQADDPRHWRRTAPLGSPVTGETWTETGPGMWVVPGSRKAVHPPSYDPSCSSTIPGMAGPWVRATRWISAARLSLSSGGVPRMSPSPVAPSSSEPTIVTLPAGLVRRPPAYPATTSARSIARLVESERGVTVDEHVVGTARSRAPGRVVEHDPPDRDGFARQQLRRAEPHRHTVVAAHQRRRPDRPCGVGEPGHRLHRGGSLFRRTRPRCSHRYHQKQHQDHGSPQPPHRSLQLTELLER